MLSCKKVTELTEKKTFTKLSNKESIQLAMHKSMCGACSLYEKQSEKMDQLLKNDYLDNTKNEKLKEKILKNLNQ